MEKVKIFRQVKKNKTALVGLTLILLLLLVALIGPRIAPYDPLVPDPPKRLLGPSLDHPFGTDSLGRDIFSRVIYGSRISIIIGLIFPERF
jgi:peptide/nickel transport system permease protein